MNLTMEEKTRIREFNEKLSDRIEIALVLTEDDRSDAFARFCETLSRFASKLKISEERNPDGLPEIRITDNLRYKAVPVGPELSPFLKALAMVSGNDTSPDLLMKYGNIENQTDLRLFVSPQCAFCPDAVSTLFPLAIYNTSVRLTVIDGLLFGELAESEDIVSAPTLILNDGFRWTGNFRLPHITDLIRTGGLSDLSAPQLENLIQQGEAGRIADMMLERKTVFPSFVDLLVHAKFDIRLGAMVAVETIAQSDIELANRLTEPLWDRFPDQIDQIKGDLLYVFGESGGKKAIPLIQKAVNDTENMELKEAGTEALEKIMSRMALKL